MDKEWITQTIRVGNAVVNIHRPILSNQEKSKREEAVITALRNYGKSLKN